MAPPYRILAENQSCQVWIHDRQTAANRLVFETRDLLLEAPNWHPAGDALILNGNGVLWHLPLAAPALTEIVITGTPPLNNDHVIAPDGEEIFLSARDSWQLYRAPLAGGAARQISGREGPPGLLHFLHGISPDGTRLAFVGMELDRRVTPAKLVAVEIWTMAADGTDYRQITRSGAPADGPEFSPDGEWIYFNTEAFSGHAQIARVRPDGSDLTRLTRSDTVDWFPHVAPDGMAAVYLAYPPGTRGHPADLAVKLMLVRDGDWSHPAEAAAFHGGQGTINVPSWSPDSRYFAYVAYPQG
jgi:Tol biopolymer transport system component